MNEDDIPTTPEVDQQLKKDAVEELLSHIQAGNPLSGDREEIPLPVKIKGEVRAYVLKELDGPGRDEYMNFQAQKVNYSSDGKIAGFKGTKGLEIKLVAACLFDSNGGNVHEDIIRRDFPGRLISTIAKIAARISGLDSEAEARAKNS